MSRLLIPALVRTTLGVALLASVALPAAGQDAASPVRAKPLEALSNSAQGIRDSLVAMARAQVGKPYRFGGRSPERGFDCSGLVQYLMSALHREMPRTAAQQAAAGLAVERDTSRLRPGDLLTFGSGKRASHVGIYVGNGRYIHASSVAGRVVESPIARRAERVKPWRGARRVIAVADEGSR